MNIFDNVPILAYHKVDDSFEWGVTRVSRGRFSEQMRFLAREHFEGMTLSKLAEKSRVGKRVVITFDDAYKSIIDNALPVMAKHSFNATVFVVTRYVGRKNTWDVNLGRNFYHMNWQNLKDLTRAGFEIGSHTHTHPDLTRITDTEIRRELSISKEILEDKLAEEVSFVSYPFGRYSDRVKEIAIDCGYKGGVCLSHPFRKRSDVFAIDRQGVYIFDTIHDFRAKILDYGKRAYFLEHIKGRSINFFAGATYPLKRLQHSFRST